MDHVHVLCSRQLHHSSLLWCWNQTNPAGALELKCKTFQYGRLVSGGVFVFVFLFYSFQYSRKPFLKDSCLSNQYYVTKLQTKTNQCHENLHVLQNHETRINIFSQPY